jgi:anion-transporting  ArsA/GET3 family ATPase
VYDAVVMDAPPTGRIARFLNVNDEVAGLARVGPVRRQADSIMAMMRSKTTQVHLVTVLEEMPVQETIDGIAELRATNLSVGHIFVNLVQAALLGDDTRDALTSGKLGTKQVAAALTSVALDADAAPALLDQGRAHLERMALQDAEREALGKTDRRIVELPTMSDGIDQGALFELAGLLRADLLGGAAS